MTAVEVSNVIEQGTREIFPEAEIIKIPIADGGEGKVQYLINAARGKILREKVTSPQGNCLPKPRCPLIWGIIISFGSLILILSLNF